MANDDYDQELDDDEEDDDEEHDLPDREDAADVASQDSETDFDDEVDDEVGPIDLLEAREADALLDDPEKVDEDE
jgi:hypothetical protein